ncbi:stage III sporulation protein AE [Aminipila luticellarii]|uniref:Stage III sporulation protein AE n=1 Tax=Aminipila luticellarii TaxID=2507160 RepID=A0A410PV67_9FIRM|nr:stage III sporulation protein AE [Aminipila luticellarii]QAT42837.1 stage III sporulation protein AE [Aminipila luticellarii]
MDYKSIIQEQLANLNLNELEQIMDDTALQSGGRVPDLSIQEIIDRAINGQPIFDSQVIIHNFIDLFLYEIKSSLILGVQLVTICIVIGLLTNLSNSFGNKAVSRLGIIVCSCFVIGLCLNNFSQTFNMCSDTLNTMTRTMQILLPILIPLLVSLGGITSGSILNPIIVGAITMFNTILQTFILPAIFISSIFILVNSLTERDYVNKLGVFLRGAATFATGLCVTFFAGLTAIQGFVSETADGVLINTARYSVNNFVPIVGGFAADSIDMVLSCIGVIKNGISIFGVILVIFLLAIPLIKLMAIAIIYKVTAIIIEPIGNKQVSGCMNEMGNSVITMAVVLFLAALMFLVFLTIIIGIGGGSLLR